MRITPEIKQKIRLYMLNHDLTQSAFAELFGVKHASVNKWLNIANISVKEPHARKLCDVLGLDYAAEMYAQSLADGSSPISVNVNGNNSGVAIQNNGASAKGYTPQEIIKAVTESHLDAETKVTVLNALAQIGLF